MGAKRGESGLSLLVAVNKPSGMSSHDAVNACRRIFGERRVGHTGTLDPLASGVLPICIGPATRLDQYMTGHDKSYLVDISFGAGTDTDDCLGQVIERAPVPPHLFDEGFARAYVLGLVGVRDQLPPRYSAVKVQGKKAYEVARKGGELELQPRSIEVFSADLVEVREDAGVPTWTVALSVSKGTYIRSIARDAGVDLGCPAHVSKLERTKAGRIALDSCVSFESLEGLKGLAAIDPVRALGLRFAFADDFERAIVNGSAIPQDALTLYDPLPMEGEEWICACSTSIDESSAESCDGELICIIVQNRLKALYRFDAHHAVFKPDAVFNVGVSRG